MTAPRAVRPIDRRLLRHGRATGGFLVAAVAVGVALAGCLVVQATLLAQVLARVLLAGADLDAVRPALLALLVVVGARAVLAWAAQVAAHLAAARVKSQLRARLLARVLELGPAFLDTERSGELAVTAGPGVDALDAYFARYLPALVQAVLVPALLLAVVAPLDPLSAVIMAATVPLIPVFMVLIGRLATRRTQRQWRLLGLLGAHFLDVVQGLSTLKAFGRAEAQRATIRDVSERLRRATMGTLRIGFLSALVLELLATLSVALVAVAIGLRLVGGVMTLERGLTVLLLAPEVYLPLRQVGAQFHASAEGLAAAGRILEVLETGPAGPAAAGPALPAPDPGTATVRFEGVSFAYPGRAGRVLDGVDLALHRGERVALVGPSGAGKSTIGLLLLRLASPDAGRITVGGVDLARVDPAAWRARVGWLPQRPYVYRGTVADNIRLGRPAADLQAVRRAARLAGADGFVDRLPHGFDTQVGERGALLSAGQRQRVALARVFLADPPLLVLDEPTANLDPGSEAAIVDALGRLAAGRTVLVLTHSRALAAAADRVLDLDRGRVAELAGATGGPG